MNMSVKTALIVTFAAALQFATADSHARDDLTIRCVPLQLPNEQAVGQALGLSNFAQVYSAREKLLRTVNHACRHGALQVTVVANPPATARLNASHWRPRVADTTTDIR